MGVNPENGLPQSVLSAASQSSPILFPEAFGAKGDGTTDDTAGIQAAMNAGGFIFFQPGKTYYIATGLTGKSGQTLWGPGATLLFADVAQKGINFQGTTAASTTLTADVVEWASAITVASNAGMSIGQHILISEGGNYGPSFCSRITGIAGTTITVEEPIPCLFLAANTPTVYVYNATGNLIERSFVKDLKFVNAAATPTLRQFFLYFQHHLDCGVENCSFTGLGAASASACYLFLGRGSWMQKNHIDKVNAAGTALGLVVDSVTLGEASHNRFRNCSSGVVVTRSPYTSMIGNRGLQNGTGGRGYKLLAGSNYSIVLGNIDSDVGGAGYNAVHITDCWGCVVNSNALSNVSNTGIDITGFLATRTQDNVIAGNAMRNIQTRSIDTSTVNGPNYVDLNGTGSMRSAYKATDRSGAGGGVLDLGSQALPYTVLAANDITTTKVIRVNCTAVGTLTIQAPAISETMAGELLTYDITNSTGGVITMNWSGSFHQAYTPPANTKRNQITFRFDGAAWIQAFAQSPDVAP